MKRNLIKLLTSVLVFSLVLVGCTKPKENLSIPTNDVEHSEPDTEKDDVSDDDMYELTGSYFKEYKNVEKKELTSDYMEQYFGTRLEKIREVFSKYSISNEDVYDDATGSLTIFGENLDNIEGDYAMRYSLGASSPGVYDTFTLEVDMRMKDPENFKFNDSILNDARTIVNSDDEDISKIVDTLVKKNFIEGVPSSFFRDKGNIRENINFFEDSLYYTFTLYNEPIGIVETASNTYDGIDGDKIEVTLSNDRGYTISEEKPFTISKDEQVLCEGNFFMKEFYEQLPGNLKSDSKSELVDTNTLNGNEFIIASSNNGELYSCYIKVAGSNTVLALAGLESEETARFILSSLEMKKVN